MSDLNTDSPALHAAKLLALDSKESYTAYDQAKIASSEESPTDISFKGEKGKRCPGMCSFIQRNCIEDVDRFISDHNPMKEDSWWMDAYGNDIVKSMTLRNRISFLSAFLKEMSIEYSQSDEGMLDAIKDHFKIAEGPLTDTVESMTITE